MRVSSLPRGGGDRRRRACMRGSCWIRSCAIFALIASILMLRPALSLAADALLDAKRREAAGALALLEEVTKAVDNVYGDQLMMARASDKLGQTSDALRHYRRVIEMTSSSPREK